MGSTQMLKGVLEGCILKIIQNKEVYGYEMISLLTEYGLDMVSDGSIYPILLKLQKQGLIVGEMRSSAEGPQRKYYHLTPTGEAHLKNFEQQWILISKSVNKLLKTK